MTIAEQLRQKGIHEGMLAGRQEGILTGRQEGMQVGLQKGIRQVALNMLASGIDKKLIEKTTGISIAELDRLESE